MRRTLVINCAALGRPMLADPAVTPHLARLAAAGQLLDLEPSFPALTCSVQATLTTGRPPSEHGIVGNGFYQRDLAEVRFWEQPATLLGAPPAWSQNAAPPRVAMLFWQNSLYADVACMITPKPLHTDSGLLNDCYSRPAALYPTLREKLGEFPLMRYWGPMAGIDSSRWIAAATEHVWRENRPDLCLTYLPQLDYNTQRRGPDPHGLADDLRDIDALVGRLAEMAQADGAETIVLSEYSLSPVSRAVALNRVLREAGLLALRELGGREYLDCGACRAFAVADHQVAHIYFPCSPHAGADHQDLAERTRDLLLSVAGVAEVLDERAQVERSIRHGRSGDLICVAQSDTWFSYYFWTDDARAPDYARTVDIHRKPGYDPVELFFDPKTRSIPLDASLVRGSHGRTGSAADPRGVLLTSAPPTVWASRTSVRADEVAKVLWA
jgi:predicted AlkP superfamily pyrophosphatase or phosphodiesterase